MAQVPPSTRPTDRARRQLRRAGRGLSPHGRQRWLVGLVHLTSSRTRDSSSNTGTGDSHGGGHAPSLTRRIQRGSPGNKQHSPTTSQRQRPGPDHRHYAPVRSSLPSLVHHHAGPSATCPAPSSRLLHRRPMPRTELHRRRHRARAVPRPRVHRHTRRDRVQMRPSSRPLRTVRAAACLHPR